MTRKVRVELPSSLCRLSGAEREIAVTISGDVTQRSVLDEIEARYPMLLGTIRDQRTKLRRPFIRFFASGEDLSHQSPDTSLPKAVTDGTEALLIIAAIAGG